MSASGPRPAPTIARPGLLELLVLGALLLQAGLVIHVLVGIVQLRAMATDVQPYTVAAVAPQGQAPATPHQDPAAAHDDACRRLGSLLRSIDGPLVNHGHPPALGDDTIARLLSQSSCRLDDPLVEAELSRVREIYRLADLEPPPVLPHLER